MPIFLLFLVGLGIFFVSSKGGAVISSLPDIDPENQQGDYDTQYDDAFSNASQASGVPFALIKAHAIRESSLNPKAYHYDNPKSGASYGLMQVEWNKGQNKLANFGYTDDQIGDGSLLYDPYISASLGAKIISDNLKRFSTLRDAVNAYNTGVKESVRQAPANYVNDVIKYYSDIVGRNVT